MSQRHLIIGANSGRVLLKGDVFIFIFDLFGEGVMPRGGHVFHYLVFD